MTRRNGTDGRPLDYSAICGCELTDGSLCSQPATVHVCPLTDEGEEADWTIYACANHADNALTVAWEHHQVSGDCGHPGAVWTYATASDPSHCEVTTAELEQCATPESAHA